MYFYEFTPIERKSRFCVNINNSSVNDEYCNRQSGVSTVSDSNLKKMSRSENKASSLLMPIRVDVWFGKCIYYKLTVFGEDEVLKSYTKNKGKTLFNPFVSYFSLGRMELIKYWIPDTTFVIRRSLFPKVRSVEIVRDKATYSSIVSALFLY